jgi:hypothetical protein
MSLSWVSSIQSIPPLPTSWISILILSYHLRLGLPSGLSLRFPHQNPYTPLLAPIRSTRPAHLILLDFITRIILGEKYIIKLLIRDFSAPSCYLIRLRPKYSPKHPFLTYPQHTFLPQYQRPSFTPIKNKQAKSWFCTYQSLYLWIEKWKKKDSDQVITREFLSTRHGASSGCGWRYGLYLIWRAAKTILYSKTCLKRTFY